MANKFTQGEYVRTTFKKGDGTKYFGRIKTVNTNKTYDVNINDWEGTNTNHVISGVMEDQLEYPWESNNV